MGFSYSTAVHLVTEYRPAPKQSHLKPTTTLAQATRKANPTNTPPRQIQSIVREIQHKAAGISELDFFLSELPSDAPVPSLLSASHEPSPLARFYGHKERQKGATKVAWTSIWGK